MLIRHLDSERGYDLYETLEVATLALLAVEPPPPRILEPACGDLRLTGIDQILCAIRKGEALHLYYENGRPFWSLSSERSVAADVATLLIRSASAAPVGNALFDGMPGQILLFDP